RVLRNGSPVRNLVLGLRPERAGGGEPSPPPLGSAPETRAVPALVRWVLVNAMPLGTPPHPAGVVTTFSDITAYRHAQEVVRHSEEKYRGLVETLPLMLVVADRDQRLGYINPATTAITGYDLQEIA